MVLTVGKYTLGTVLHADSESVVRLATHKDTTNSYAIRMLEKSAIRRRGQSGAVKRQVSAMSELQHDNIVRLHEVLSSPTKLYLVMELVQGDDLGSYVAKFGKLSCFNARQLVKTIANALAYAHSRGVFHGALSPSCILRPHGANWSHVKLYGFNQFNPSDSRLAAANDARALAALLALAIFAQPPPLPNTAPAGARDLFAKLEHVDPLQRPELKDVLQHIWFTQDDNNEDEDDNVISPNYNHINNLPLRNHRRRRRRRRDEMRLSDIKFPTPQGDSSDDDGGDTFPANVPMMETIDFLPKYEQNRDDSVRAFQQIENSNGHSSPPISPTSPRSPNDFVQRRLPRTKPVRYPVSPLRDTQFSSPKPIAVRLSPRRVGNTSAMNSPFSSPRNYNDDDDDYTRRIIQYRQRSPSPMQLTETVVLHRMGSPEHEMQQYQQQQQQQQQQPLLLLPPPTRPTNLASPTPMNINSPSGQRRSFKMSPIMKRHHNSSSSPPCSNSAGPRFPRSTARHDLNITPPPLSSDLMTDDTPISSSSTVSFDDESNSLNRLVRSTLPRFSTQRTKIVMDALADAGVDDVNDLRFVVQTKRGVLAAADWLERVTHLPALTCLKVMHEASKHMPSNRVF